MKKIVYMFLVFMTFTICLYQHVSADENDDSYIVKLKTETTQLIEEDIQAIPYSDNLYTISEEGINRLENNDDVEFIIPNYDVELFDVPNDTEYNNQWSLKDWGYDDVYSQGITGKNIRIGIIDSGVYSSHPDLQGNISYESYNVITQDNDCSDEYGHGTFVSGIIGAITDNQIGISGIASGADIIMIKCFDGKTTKVSYVISALNYAATLNLDIVNLSFGVALSESSTNLQLMKEAIDNLYDSGAIIVAAVGNSGNSTLYYPAAFDNVIGVGSVDETLLYSDSSQYNNSVFVTAPGVNIYGLCSPDLEDGAYYKEMTGTSFAAPYVAASIALTKECVPELTFDDICSLLKSSSKDLGEAGYDNYYGWGVLNPKVLVDNVINGTKVYISTPSYEKSEDKVIVSQKTINRSGRDISLIYGMYIGNELIDIKKTEFSDVISF